MAIELNSHQIECINKIRNGSIVVGGVGSGKSRVGIAYYIFMVCDGDVKVISDDLPSFTHQSFKPMKRPRDLYIITTAKKRDDLEWEKELTSFGFSAFDVNVVIDSWNNIKKYKDVYSAFFLFDEQRLVGSGVWVKTFLNIARKNQWILLSATPGDQWIDYIAVFVANGFYRNKTDFCSNHCIYKRYSKYPIIERYYNEKLLEYYRDQITVELKDNRKTIRNDIYITCDHDRKLFKEVYINYWDPYENCPIKEKGKYMYLLRKVVNSDPSRIMELQKIIEEKKRIIVFYNFNYELEEIEKFLDQINYPYAEWNGKKHQVIPETKKWVYLVQYSAGSEGWNCTKTDTIVFFSQNYSYRILEQSRGRIDRINTPYIYLYYYHFRSTAIIDQKIYEKLKNKKNFNERSFKRAQRRY